MKENGFRGSSKKKGKMRQEHKRQQQGSRVNISREEDGTHRIEVTPEVYDEMMKDPKHPMWEACRRAAVCKATCIDTSISIRGSPL